MYCILKKYSPEVQEFALFSRDFWPQEAKVLFQPTIFRGKLAVSFREGIHMLLLCRSTVVTNRKIELVDESEDLLICS